MTTAPAVSPAPPRRHGCLIVHAEDPAGIGPLPGPPAAPYAGFLRSRPGRAEDVAIAKAVDLARRTGARGQQTTTGRPR